jgi:hypothetical protein
MPDAVIAVRRLELILLSTSINGVFVQQRLMRRSFLRANSSDGVVSLEQTDFGVYARKARVGLPCGIDGGGRVVALSKLTLGCLPVH